MNCLDGSEPKDLFSGCRYNFPNRGKSTLRIQNHEYVKAALSKATFKIPRDGELEIVSDFFLPDLHAFVAQVNFDEARENSCWCLKFKVAVRNKPKLRREWLVEAYPPVKGGTWDRRRSSFERAVDFIYSELVIHE